MGADGNAQVYVALISAIGGVLAAYLTVKYKDRVIKRTAKPKDRMETIFDGYEKLILSQQEEISRKSLVINSLEKVIDRLEDELHQTRQLLNDARDELERSVVQNRQLKTQLGGMKKDYAEEQHRLEKLK